MMNRLNWSEAKRKEVNVEYRSPLPMWIDNVYADYMLPVNPPVRPVIGKRYYETVLTEAGVKKAYVDSDYIMKDDNGEIWVISYDRFDKDFEMISHE